MALPVKVRVGPRVDRERARAAFIADGGNVEEIERIERAFEIEAL